MNNKVVAIVPAAGIGSRFDSSIRKTFVPINGIPLLMHTLRNINGIESISEIIPVLNQEDVVGWEEIIKTGKLGKVRKIIPGGPERQDSIYNALKIIEEEDCLVLIHDGVRPVIPAGLVERLIQGINSFDGIIPVIPLKDTIKRVNSDGFVASTADREELRAVQTPQVFHSKAIKEAYGRAYSDGFHATDDAALVERIGGKIKIVDGSPLNIKVTTPEDLKMVECIIREKEL